MRIARNTSGGENMAASEFASIKKTDDAEPTAWLGFPAGLATAGGAFAKFKPGELLPAAETGAWEYKDGVLYFTPAGSRKAFVFADQAFLLSQILAKGDLLVGSGEGAVVLLPITNIPDGYALVKDAASPGGMKWALIEGGGGEPGVGVPAGGTTDQVLAKLSDVDYDTGWVDRGGGGPSTIPGLIGWWAARNIKFLADGNTVNDWPNWAPNPYGHMIKNAGTPVYKTNILNGLPVVRFPGTAEFTAPDFDFWSPFVTKGHTIIAVSTISDTSFNTGNGQAICGKGTSSQFEFALFGLYSVTKPKIEHWDLAGNVYATRQHGSDITQGVFTILTSRLRYGVQSKIWQNGGAGAATTSFTGNMGNGTAALFLGSRAAGVSPFKGDIAEVMIFNRALSDAELDAIHAYLGALYNIAVTAVS
jgi:hypothetical protein